MEENKAGVAVTPQTQVPSKNPIKDFFAKDIVKQKIEEVLGSKSVVFTTSLLQIVSQSEMLSKATPDSIFHAAIVAATLNLPLNNSLGYAYIVPFNEKQKGQNGQLDTWITKGQFMLGYKGFIQLAQRSGQFKTINCVEVKEGEIEFFDRLSGEITFKWSVEGREKLKTVGYVAYFKLLNGFEKSMYMTVEELVDHGKRFSQTFKKGFGLWKDDFDAMASKTVTKLLLAKYAPLSVDIQRAVITDQAIIKDSETLDVTYVDNEQP